MRNEQIPMVPKSGLLRISNRAASPALKNTMVPKSGPQGREPISQYRENGGKPGPTSSQQGPCGDVAPSLRKLERRFKLVQLIEAAQLSESVVLDAVRDMGSAALSMDALEALALKALAKITKTEAV